jgi:transcriptional regulator with GAF, ATPase, and Fis domain
MLEDAGSTNGSLLNGARVDRARLADGDVIELGETFLLYREALPVLAGAAPDQAAAALDASAPGLVTLSPAFSRQLDQLRALAPSGISVLVRGDSGTGKELMARALHQLSGRTGAFVPVNCGALPATLIESELFGYRKGAFSGALADRLGLVRSADQGTLFLDEIGDLPLPAQAALLRVLQERDVLPVGATRAVPIDVRWVAATHRDLEGMVAEGQFRADLLARLNGWTLTVPPLRERREDVGLVAQALLARPGAAPAGPVRFSWEVARALLRYDWPLNVRELEQALRTAVVLSGGALALDHLPEAVRRAARPGSVTPASTAAPSDDETPGASVQPLAPEEEQRRDRLIALFTEHHGNLAAVARAMDRAPIQIRRWAKRYGIDLDRFRS